MKKGIRFFLLFIIVGLGFLLVWNVLEREKVKEQYEQLAHEVTKTVEFGKEDTIYDKYSTNHQKQDDSQDWYKEYGIQVDFTSLGEINSEIVAWIKFDKVGIDYPIIHAKNNEDYLRKDIFGEDADAGSIFMEASNRGDFKEYHIILYGHNMRNGTMFGQLKKYREKDFYEENRYFTIYTKDYVMRYEIFSCHDTKAYGSVYTVGFINDETYQDYIDTLQRASWYQYQGVVSNEDQIVTLSTCSAGEDNRFVVHGKLIEVLPAKNGN